MIETRVFMLLFLDENSTVSRDDFFFFFNGINGHFCQSKSFYRLLKALKIAAYCMDMFAYLHKQTSFQYDFLKR